MRGVWLDSLSQEEGLCQYTTIIFQSANIDKNKRFTMRPALYYAATAGV